MYGGIFFAIFFLCLSIFIIVFLPSLILRFYSYSASFAVSDEIAFDLSNSSISFGSISKGAFSSRVVTITPDVDGVLVVRVDDDFDDYFSTIS